MRKDKRRAKEARELDVPEAPTNLTETEEYLPLTLDEHFEEALRRQDYERRISDTRIVSAIHPRFNENKPIAIVHLSDVHIGSHGTDYKALQAHLKIIHDTPGMYAVFMGDELDNFIVGKLSSVSKFDILQPTAQWKFVEAMLEYIAPKTLAMVRGNHNAWTVAASGLDPQGRFLNQMKILDIGHGGSIYLDVCGAEYRIYLRHKFRFESSLNPFNAVWRLFDFFGPFDVGSIGHTHVKGISETVRQGRPIIAVRPGSYKVHDDFGDSLGFEPAVAHAPTIIYFPKTKRMMPFDDIEQAARYLTYLRTGEFKGR